MQLTTRDAWRHAFDEFEHGLRGSWHRAKSAVRRLLSRSERGSGARGSSAPSRALWGGRDRLNRLFWHGGPNLEVGETDTEFVLRADLPGLSQDELSIEIEGRFVTLRAGQRSRREETGRGYFYSEQAFGSFSRTIPLSGEVEASRAKAKYRRGQLTITLPKTTESRSLRVPVQG